MNTYNFQSEKGHEVFSTRGNARSASPQTKFEKEAVDNAVDSAHSVCRPVRFAVSRSRFLGVSGSGRRPLESADPGVRRVGAIGTESNAGLGLGKLYGGRGLGAQVDPRCPFCFPGSVVL